MSSVFSSFALPFLSGNTKVVGVFGYPVEHSLSPAMHNAALAALQIPFVYVPFGVAPAALEDAIKSISALGIVGVNVTIPHKEAVVPFLEDISVEARQVGAVNTIYRREGRLLGDNTDGRGFADPLYALGVRLPKMNAVVFGAGGAARAVVFRLAREGARLTLVNRTNERAARLAQAASFEASGPIEILPLEDSKRVAAALKKANLLVNTTRVGMFPDQEAMLPIPVEALHPGLLVYDLVYNPTETQLLRTARLQGCSTLNGVKMLVGQGAASFQLWTGQWPPLAVMEAAVLSGLEMKS